MNNRNTIRNSIVLFMICLAVHAFEVLVIRTDETFFAECFINKVFGIAALFAVLRMMKMKWRGIGFKKEDFATGVLKGFGICAASYFIAFVIEFIVLSAQGSPAHMEYFVTGFSLTGNMMKNTGAGFVLMCIFFNIINVWMEEGVFRGFFITYISKEHGASRALYISALLFGLWHIVTPFRSLIDGDMTAGTFAVMTVGYIVLSSLMGIKWGLLYRQTGNIWIGASDHFFNNCIVTNLLHVVTDSGVDEMQIVRVIIGELISFAAVVIYTRLKGSASGKVSFAERKGQGI
ncbi:MAG: CPBP family intramembrane metalloprotease [Oscillospiraceae bacterium]|nr:CPBP family intramembrane metalloprotease [Oscillospiraceae bacterium]